VKPVDRSQEITIATAENGKWRLVHLPLWSGGGWQTIRVYGPGKFRQRQYSFGWNRQRLSRVNDANDLKKLHPKIYQWVIETLSAQKASP